MLIDFHIHTFSDKIAEKTIAKLSETAKKKSETNGTLKDTLAKMEEWGVDAAVVLNIATKPTQHKIVNDFAQNICSDKLYGFGSIFPVISEENTLPNIESELNRIIESGLKGIKIHPDYQGFYFDDEKIYPVYELLQSKKIFTVTHAGVDAICPNDVHCTPKMIKKVLENFPKLRLSAAHMGGHLLWEEVENEIADKNLYLDTSFITTSLDKSLAERIIKKHGADHILFGSDCPWDSPFATFKFIDSLNLTPTEKDLIFYKNARSVLYGS